ncbi:MAG: class I SAM-dependent methyltransferase [Bacteroidales bacterium]
MKKRFENRYKTGDLPWDIKRPDYNLVNAIEAFDIRPGKALDIGCGTGDNVIWLSKNGFNMTGVDLSETAIGMARNKAESENIVADFYAADFLSEEIPGHPFSFVFDRGCFHTFDRKKKRKKFAARVSEILEAGGRWLSLIGNYDDGRLDVGPPKRRASEITKAVEPFFEILSMVQGRFDSNDEIPSKIWICLMKRKP